MLAQSFLLYANFNKEKGMWEMFYCRRGGHLSGADDDLLYLESLQTNKGKSRLSGTLAYWNWQLSTGLHRIRNLDGTKVKIASKSKSYEVVTDKNGIYEIYGLPIEEYKITPEIPQGMKIRFPLVYGIIQDESLENGRSISVDSE